MVVIALVFYITLIVWFWTCVRNALTKQTTVFGTIAYDKRKAPIGYYMFFVADSLALIFSVAMFMMLIIKICFGFPH
jgi:hypothetical protein